MLLLDDLLLAPGKAVMTLFEEMARKAQEEFLDDGPVKKELQAIYALLEAGNLSENDFATREHHLLQRLEQIARARFNLPAPGVLPAPDVLPAESVPAVHFDVPNLTTLQLPVIDVPTIELPSLELPEAALPRADLPRFELPPLELPHIELPHIELPHTEFRVERPPLVPVATPPPSRAPVQAPPVSAVPVTAVSEPPKEAPPVRMTPAQVVESTLRGLAMLKMRVSTVTAVARVANGWQVIVELIESRAVPDTSDLLGIYEVQLDESGNILGYERTRMRRRCDLGDRR